MHAALGPQSPAPSHTAHSTQQIKPPRSWVPAADARGGAPSQLAVKKTHKKKLEQKKLLPAASPGNTTRQEGRKTCQCTHEAFKCRHKRKSVRSRGAPNCGVEEKKRRNGPLSAEAKSLFPVGRCSHPYLEGRLFRGTSPWECVQGCASGCRKRKKMILNVLWRRRRSTHGHWLKMGGGEHNR